jgi:siroheme synthase-like protein
MPTPGAPYPVQLVVAGRRCLVVGGGRVATRKVNGLLACGAVVQVVAPDVDDELQGWTRTPPPGGGSLTVEARPYRSPEASDYRLVVTATGDPDVDGQVFADAEAAGVWVNSADDPDHCSFTLPAVLRRGPVVVAVGTGGHSPALASWLRDRLGEAVGPEHAVLADLLAEERRTMQAAGRSTEEVDWRKALDSDILGLIRDGRVTEAKERLQACLSSS